METPVLNLPCTSTYQVPSTSNATTVQCNASVQQKAFNPAAADFLKGRKDHVRQATTSKLSGVYKSASFKGTITSTNGFVTAVHTQNKDDADKKCQPACTTTSNSAAPSVAPPPRPSFIPGPKGLARSSTFRASISSSVPPRPAPPPIPAKIQPPIPAFGQTEVSIYPF